ncbi:hypothetical protein [Clostridium sp. AM58-1XD]|uniref:hypothetical protein n=1 Tax=Clostridium sp. AM58-1XD TaxID=2292307 RepID=UPI000E4BEB33|nr:hypothetical protein [Clostridium sp. AM58-1XD]RGY96825.1 hypothetical protein DXA13_16145 [Clostridium sp. AM58-1XD]
MNISERKKANRHKNDRRRWAAALLILCLMMSSLNFEFMLAYATEDSVRTFYVGDDVKAIIVDGVLKIKGSGDTYDFTEETAPFLEYGDEIDSLVIENGVTYVGSYLFYGLGNLRGELRLPESIVGFGDYAFSGRDKYSAPRFSMIINEFIEGEIVEDGSKESGDIAVSTPSEAVVETIDSEGEYDGIGKPEDISSSREPETEKRTEEAAEENPETEPGQETEEEAIQQPQAKIERHMVPVVGEAPGVEQEESGSGKETSNSGSVHDTAGQTGSSSENTGQNTEQKAGEKTETEKTEDQAGAEKGETAGKDEVSGEEENKDSLPPADENNESDGTGGLDSTVISDNTDHSDKEENTESAESMENADGIEKDEKPSAAGGVPDGAFDSGSGGGADASKSEEDEEIPDDIEYDVEYIIEQKIENPETLFYEGQTGLMICSEDNGSFIEAGEYAGYELADGFMTVTLDEMVDMELPVRDGRICLPECPKELVYPEEDEGMFSRRFAGWSSEQDGSAPVQEAGEFMDVMEGDQLNLYSVWETAGNYEFCIEKDREGDIAVYTLTDNITGEVPEYSDGYMFLYQWQLSEQEKPHDDRPAGELNDRPVRTPSEVYSGNFGEDDGWEDIQGADAPVYRRHVEPEGVSRQVRCVITAVKVTRARSTEGQITMLSEQVTALSELKTVYVDQQIGDDAKDGAGADPGNPVQTMEKAAELLSESGTVEDNKIILLSGYTMKTAAEGEFLKNTPRNVTVRGNTGSETFSIEKGSNGELLPFTLYGDVTFENMTLGLQHIYGNGHNIKLGTNVKTSIRPYLYGAGNNNMSDKVGSIEVLSGSIVRINGYLRSNSDVDADNKLAAITVGGTAIVDTIIAGSANGKLSNGNVVINVKGGQVGYVVGGCQGHQNTPAPYSGTTTINISGGKVTSIYGAGSGRVSSIPTFCGTLNINVAGGDVDNIYGSGSAAI